MKILDFFGGRLVLAALLAFKTFDTLFAPALTFAYRLNLLGIAERLGQVTPGDDYRRLIPLMKAIPWGLLGSASLAAVLYGVACVLVFVHIARAYLFVIAAFGIETITTLLVKPILTATGIAVNPHPSLVSTVCIPYLLPGLLILVLWLARGTRPAGQG